MSRGVFTSIAVLCSLPSAPEKYLMWARKTRGVPFCGPVRS